MMLTEHSRKMHPTNPLTNTTGINHAATDGLRTVVDRHDIYRPRQRRANARRRIAYLFRHLHRIRTGSAEDGDDDRSRGNLMATHPETHADALVLHAIAGLGHIFQINRAPAILADDEVVIIFGLVQLPLGLQQEALM